MLRRPITFALIGFGIDVTFVVYQHFIDFTVRPSGLTTSLIAFFTILCPPSLLSIPIIDAEVGTSGFYILWTVIGLLNAVLYAAIATMVLRLQKNRLPPR